MISQLKDPVSTLSNIYHLQAETATKKPQLSSIALAHELRNPLTNINLATAMLSSLMRDVDQKIYLDIIIRSTLKIQAQVNELISHEHKEKSHLQKYVLHKLIDEVLLLNADRLVLKNIIVSKMYILQDYAKWVDVKGMKIALGNLIINATDAMQPGGKLTITTLMLRGHFTIRIEDNGCGISKDNLPKIFDAYFTNKPTGLGIGLSATQDILRTHKVRVHVSSIEGTGTIFTLSFSKERIHTC